MKNKTPFPRHVRNALVIALSYLTLALGWIVLSDQTVGSRVTSVEALITAQTLKGIGFVLVTAILLFGSVAALMKQLADSRDKLAVRTQELHAILDSQIDLVCRYTPDTVVTFANDAYCHHVGVPREMVLGRPFITRVMLEERDFVYSRIEETITTREPNVSVVSGVRGNGFVAHIEWVTQVVSAPGEEPAIIQAVGRDVTERIAAREALIRLNDELETRIRERTEELRQANIDLHQLAEAKDVFVSNVSHELRSPLTSMKLHAAMLAKQHPQPNKHITSIQRDITRMEQTIDDLRDLARIEQQSTPPEPHPVDLTELVSAYMRDRVIMVRAKDLTLDVRPPGEALPQVQGVPSLIEQVAGILLSNAMAYTPQGGRVAVEFEHKYYNGSEYVGFSIADTGIGIPPEEQAAIFERFYRGRQARKQHDTGTGLGLPIAKAIVESHSGHIDLTSTPGEGSRFTVWLPC